MDRWAGLGDDPLDQRFFRQGLVEHHQLPASPRSSRRGSASADDHAGMPRRWAWQAQSPHGCRRTWHDALPAPASPSERNLTRRRFLNEAVAWRSQLTKTCARSAPTGGRAGTARMTEPATAAARMSSRVGIMGGPRGFWRTHTIVSRSARKSEPFFSAGAPHNRAVVVRNVKSSKRTRPEAERPGASVSASPHLAKGPNGRAVAAMSEFDMPRGCLKRYRSLRGSGILVDHRAPKRRSRESRAQGHVHPGTRARRWIRIEQTHTDVLMS